MKRIFILLGTSLIVLVVVGNLFLDFINSPSRMFYGTPFARANTTEKVVALTFDDGPLPGTTDEILSILNEASVSATFFLIGNDIAAHPEEARKIVSGGHQIGNHSYTHQRMVFQDRAFVSSELERTDEQIRTSGYQGEILFRPPYGKKFITLSRYLADTGRTAVMWDVEPEEDEEIRASAERIVEYTVEQVKPGSIIILHVFHESNRESLDAVPEIIARLRADGYRFVTVDELRRMDTPVP